LDSDGVAAAKKDGTIVHVPVRPAKVADTTGAGDTLNGAFCTMLAENADLESALRFCKYSCKPFPQRSLEHRQECRHVKKLKRS